MPHTCPGELCAALRRARVVLCDLFRTLASVEDANPPGAPTPAQTLGLQVEPLASAWAAAWQATTDDRVLGRIATAYDVLAIPARLAAPHLPEAVIAAAVATRQQRFDNALMRVRPEVLTALAALRRGGWRLGLVSNADYMDIHAWGRSPLRDCFDVAAFSCEVGGAKPRAGLYLAACNALGVSPEACLYVGDGGNDELRAAAALGMTPVQLTGILTRYFPELVEAQRAGVRLRIATLGELAACVASGARPPA